METTDNFQANPNHTYQVENNNELKEIGPNQNMGDVNSPWNATFNPQYNNNNLPPANQNSYNDDHPGKKDEKATNFENIGGFGADYFNIRDPNFNKKNVPVKLGCSFHGKVLFFNFVFLGLLIFGAIGLNRLFGLEVFLPMVIISYLCYLCSAICYS